MYNIILQSPILAASAHMPLAIRSLSNILLNLRGPMSAGDKFIILSDEYISKFDEVVVIGDIHGCYDEFEELLKKIHSTTPSKNDRKCLKILVGDLVNKGPNSTKVLKLCRDIYPDSILSVRGNHDNFILNMKKEYDLTKKPLEPINKWVETMNSRYVDYLSKLPYTIRIPSLNSIVVHGGLNPSLEDPATQTDLLDMMSMRNIVVKKNDETKELTYECTKLHTVGACWANFWPGPQHVYFGHDARRRLQKDHEFATGLDSGCVYGDSLSAMFIKGPRKGELVSVKAKKIYVPTGDGED